MNNAYGNIVITLCNKNRYNYCDGETKIQDNLPKLRLINNLKTYKVMQSSVKKIVIIKKSDKINK